MSCQHKELSAGRWKELSFLEQMANIGSEVERALNWQAKNNPDYCKKAVERALELLDLTIDCFNDFPHLKELLRAKEALLDYFFGKNEFASSDSLWRKYFFSFAYACRKNH